PVVIDFGIAHPPDGPPLAKAGLAMGTPGYLPPEVIEGEPCQPSSDVYSWGATVAFAARGESVYGTGPHEAIRRRILRSQADLAGLHGELHPLVAAALLRQPEQRPSAAWLASQLVDTDLADPVPLPAELTAGGASPAPAGAAGDSPGTAVAAPERPSRP